MIHHGCFAALITDEEGAGAAMLASGRKLAIGERRISADLARRESHRSKCSERRMADNRSERECILITKSTSSQTAKFLTVQRAESRDETAPPILAIAN